MPAGDRTGPWGLGPMTGRAAGYCAGYPVPGYMNPVPGFGWGYGFGRGRGRGWGRGFGRGQGYGFSRGRGRGWGRGFGRGRGFYPPMYPFAPIPYASMPYAYHPSMQYSNQTPYWYPPIHPPVAPYAQYWGPAQYAGYW